MLRGLIGNVSPYPPASSACIWYRLETVCLSISLSRLHSLHTALVCACTGSALAYYRSRCRCRWDTTCYFGPRLVIVWLPLQEARHHLAPRTCGVVIGTQSKQHTHTYIVVYTQTMMLHVCGAEQCVLEIGLVVERELWTYAQLPHKWTKMWSPNNFRRWTCYLYISALSTKLCSLYWNAESCSFALSKKLEGRTFLCRAFQFFTLSLIKFMPKHLLLFINCPYANISFSDHELYGAVLRGCFTNLSPSHMDRPWVECH